VEGSGLWLKDMGYPQDSRTVAAGAAVPSPPERSLTYHQATMPRRGQPKRRRVSALRSIEDADVLICGASFAGLGLATVRLAANRFAGTADRRFAYDYDFYRPTNRRSAAASPQPG